jgi:ATP-binding cassette subfamily B protein
VRLKRAVRTVRLAVSLVWAAGRGDLLAIIAASVITSMAIAGQLLVGRTLLDLLADGDGVDAGDLAPHLVLLGILLVVGSVSQAVAGELRIPLGEDVYRRTMGEILDVATEVDLEAYEDPEFHNRLRRAQAAAAGQSAAVVFGLVTIISTLVVTVGVVAVLFTVAPVLLPIALLGYVPIALVNVRNNRARYEMEVGLTELDRDRFYYEFALTERADAKEIRAYGVAPTLRRWHDELWSTRLQQLRTLVKRRMALTTLGSLVTTAVLIATLSIALILAARGSITVGDAAVAIVGLQQLSGRMQSAGVAFSAVHEGLTFLRDFEQFRDTLPLIRARQPTGRPPSPPTTISVDHVGYRYPDAHDDALRDISFELRRGDVMAIVGSNGSGKSTLAKLLCGLLPPTRGTIAWNGVDLATCDPNLVRREVAPVFQDFTRFMLTIRHGIALGDVSRLDDEAAVRAAARRAGLDELIASYPEGLDVRLGKLFLDGTDISGGQWQRLAIARALFRDAPIVLMDEPSASLDPQAESDLFDMLRAMADDRIIVFVSHRFATVRDADVVLVLEDGDVVEIGSHDELMDAGGLYHDLFELQAARYGSGR